MKTFVANILLALTWVAMTADFTPLGFFSGFAFSFLTLFLAQPVVGGSSYFRKIPRAIEFVLFYLGELLLANARVASDVATPGYRIQPGVVAVPLDARTDAEITMLANLIAITPGSLALDVAPDRRTMYVHVMYLRDPDRQRREIKEGLERRVLELLR